MKRLLFFLACFWGTIALHGAATDANNMQFTQRNAAGTQWVQKYFTTSGQINDMAALAAELGVAAGASILVDAGAPDNGTGNNGDLYINSTTDEYYRKAAGSWGSVLGDLTGDTGPTGSTGNTGATGPGYGGTATDTRTPSISTISLTTQTGLAWAQNGAIAMVSAADSTNYGAGTVASYTSGTGAIQIAVTGVGSGAASASDWNLVPWTPYPTELLVETIQVTNVLEDKAEADLASATTTSIGAQNAQHLRITGTTAITGFGTISAGVTRHLRFAGALTLTHNGTSLILPAATNITTAAGDTCTAVSLGSGNWVVVDYQRASGLGIAEPVLGTNTSGSYAAGDAEAGAATSIPSANDPDTSTEGQLRWDANGEYLRMYDGSVQVAVGQRRHTIQVTVVLPNDLADSERDAFWAWSNETGMSFVVTGWIFWSDTDDTTLNIEEIDADGANNTTVDAVEIATNGTGLFSATDTTITAATIETGHLLVLDFDDTDTPGQVKGTIYGYLAGDVN
jgi:hypothetical protein